jgi:DNA-binding MarR family transcriptional regulator
MITTPNPRHQRSPLYALTGLGTRAFADAMALEAAWADGLVAGLSPQDLQKTLETLTTIYERLDSPVPRKGIRP